MPAQRGHANAAHGGDSQRANGFSFAGRPTRAGLLVAVRRMGGGIAAGWPKLRLVPGPKTLLDSLIVPHRAPTISEVGGVGPAKFALLATLLERLRAPGRETRAQQRAPGRETRAQQREERRASRSRLPGGT
jgi:hypothetical protein